MVRISLFPREFVFPNYERSSYIYFGQDDRATKVDLPIYVGSIPIEHIYSFDQKLNTSLTRIAEEGVDMKRMTQVIDRDLRQVSTYFYSLRYIY